MYCFMLSLLIIILSQKYLCFIQYIYDARLLRLCHYVCFVEIGKDLTAGHAPSFDVLMFNAMAILIN